MGQLKITRSKEWANSKFNYKIFVDGKEQFEIANGQERLLTLDNDATVQAKLMWGGSESVYITLDKGQTVELSVKANKGFNIRFPFFALTISILCIVVNLANPHNGAKIFMTSIMAGIIIYAFCLVTIWRNKFLDIEVLPDLSTIPQ
jgi:hypothetical protein